jgi:hypothetical protein
VADSQDPGLQDSLHHLKGILVGVWSAALGQEVEVEEVEGVEGLSVLPAKNQSCPGERQGHQALPR